MTTGRLCEIWFGLAFKSSLESTGDTIGGRISMRCYPRCNGVRLGAHVDANLFTILWADGPGFQVPDAAAAGLSKEDCLRAGLPTLSSVRFWNIEYSYSSSLSPPPFFFPCSCVVKCTD